MSQSPATGGTRKAPAKVELRAVDDDERACASTAGSSATSRS